MTKRNANPGCGTRYDQPDAVENREAMRQQRPGVFLNYVCPVCGKNKGRQFNHDKCSKILQARRTKSDSTL